MEVLDKGTELYKSQELVVILRLSRGPREKVRVLFIPKNKKILYCKVLKNYAFQSVINNLLLLLLLWLVPSCATLVY